jgi:hypothetical protein
MLLQLIDNSLREFDLPDVDLVGMRFEDRISRTAAMAGTLKPTFPR